MYKKLEPIRDLFGIWNQNLQNAYVLGWCMKAHKQLNYIRRRLPFEVYMLSKPGKQGIKNVDCICQWNITYLEDSDLHRERATTGARAQPMVKAVQALTQKPTLTAKMGQLWDKVWDWLEYRSARNLPWFVLWRRTGLNFR